MKCFTSSLKFVLDNRSKTSAIFSVVKPILTAAYSECGVNTYSCMCSGRHTGSATAIKKSYAALYRGLNDSKKILPSEHTHNGRLGWSTFKLKSLKSFSPNPVPPSQSELVAFSSSLSESSSDSSSDSSDSAALLFFPVFFLLLFFFLFLSPSSSSSSSSSSLFSRSANDVEVLPPRNAFCFILNVSSGCVVFVLVLFSFLSSLDASSSSSSSSSSASSKSSSSSKDDDDESGGEGLLSSVFFFFFFLNVTFSVSPSVFLSFFASIIARAVKVRLAFCLFLLQ